MIVIGLTGSIGMGKTTAANMLRARGLPVFCADEAVKTLYHDPQVIAQIAQHFPDAYDKKTGLIDRAQLKKQLGQDHGKLDILQTILHPPVRQAEHDFIRSARLNGADMAVLDIPLLFETGADDLIDYVLCASAPDFIQRQRVMARPGMSEDMFAFISARQMPDQEKKKRADFVIPTGLSHAHTRRKIGEALNAITQRARSNQPSSLPHKRQP